VNLRAASAGSLLAGVGREASLVSGEDSSFPPTNRYAGECVSSQFGGGELRIESRLFTCEAAPARNFFWFPGINSERNPNSRI
jgi:hypothetical protein